MKVRTEEELLDRIDGEMGWRRADITRLDGILAHHKGQGLIYATLLRSAVPILYAHWEGFIKEVSTCYLHYIAIRKFKFSAINTGILSLFIQSEFLNGNGTNFQRARKICAFFQNALEERNSIMKIPEPIRTKSNLNSAVFREITEILDIDYEPFRAFEHFIDLKLLEARNTIAHGEYREIDPDSYTEIKQNVIRLLDEFRTQIVNQVVLKKYVRLEIE